MLSYEITLTRYKPSVPIYQQLRDATCRISVWNVNESDGKVHTTSMYNIVCTSLSVETQIITLYLDTELECQLFWCSRVSVWIRRSFQHLGVPISVWIRQSFQFLGALFSVWKRQSFQRKYRYCFHIQVLVSWF